MVKLRKNIFKFLTLIVDCSSCLMHGLTRKRNTKIELVA